MPVSRHASGRDHSSRANRRRPNHHSGRISVELDGRAEACFVKFGIATIATAFSSNQCATNCANQRIGMRSALFHALPFFGDTAGGSNCVHKVIWYGCCESSFSAHGRMPVVGTALAYLMEVDHEEVFLVDRVGRSGLLRICVFRGRTMATKSRVLLLPTVHHVQRQITAIPIILRPDAGVVVETPSYYYGPGYYPRYGGRRGWRR